MRHREFKLRKIILGVRMYFRHTSKDVAQLLNSTSSVWESVGTCNRVTDYLKMSSKQHQLTCSKTVWTSIGKIWASIADWLCSSSFPDSKYFQTPSTSTSNVNIFWGWLVFVIFSPWGQLALFCWCQQFLFYNLKIL